MTVEQLWDKTWRIIAGLENANVEFLDAVNETTEQIFNYLWKRKSDLIREPMVLDALTVDASGAWYALPADLRGICELPRLQGTRQQLEPSLEDDRNTLSGVTGEPTHYELVAGRLYVYPQPEDENTALVGRYFKWPGQASGFDDSLPFSGMFDAAYKTILIAIASQSVPVNLEQIVEQHIGQLLEVRDYHTPVRSRIRDF